MQRVSKLTTALAIALIFMATSRLASTNNIFAISSCTSTMIPRIWTRPFSSTSISTSTSTPSLVPQDYTLCRFGVSVFDGLSASCSTQREGLNVNTLNDTTATATLSTASPTSSNTNTKHYDRQLVSLVEMLELEKSNSNSPTTRSSPNKESQQKKQQPGHCHILLEPSTTTSTASTITPVSMTTNQTSNKTSQQITSTSSCWNNLPMGRARSYPPWGSTACPTTVKPAVSNTKKPHPQLAVVGLILDPSHRHVLLTRRPHYMRSFPGAWVLPGGGFDHHLDGSLGEALRREINEETGLSLQGRLQQSTLDNHKSDTLSSSSSSSIQPVCIWESCYPTDPQAPGPIRAHHLFVFCQARVQHFRTNEDDGHAKQRIHESKGNQEPQSLPSLQLQLQTSEVESALWLSVSDFLQVLERVEESSSSDNGTSQQHKLPSVPIHHADGTVGTISLDTLVGIYPQPESNNTNISASSQQQQQWCGIAQGSLFALQELLHQQQQQHQRDSATTTATTSESTATCAMEPSLDNSKDITMDCWSRL